MKKAPAMKAMKSMKKAAAGSRKRAASSRGPGRPAKGAKKGERIFLFSSESVNEGHPDKICDQVSDAVLDTCLREDPHSKVACETATKDNMVMVAGEITTQAWVDYDR